MFCCCSTTHKSTEAEIIAPFTIEKEPEEGKIVKVGDPGEKLVISLEKSQQTSQSTTSGSGSLLGLHNLFKSNNQAAINTKTAFAKTTSSLTPETQQSPTFNILIGEQNLVNNNLTPFTRSEIPSRDERVLDRSQNESGFVPARMGPASGGSFDLNLVKTTENGKKAIPDSNSNAGAMDSSRKDVLDSARSEASGHMHNNIMSLKDMYKDIFENHSNNATNTNDSKTRSVSADLRNFQMGINPYEEASFKRTGLSNFSSIASTGTKDNSSFTNSIFDPLKGLPNYTSQYSQSIVNPGINAGTPAFGNHYTTPNSGINGLSNIYGASNNNVTNTGGTNGINNYNHLLPNNNNNNIYAYLNITQPGQTQTYVSPNGEIDNRIFATFGTPPNGENPLKIDSRNDSAERSPISQRGSNKSVKFEDDSKNVSANGTPRKDYWKKITDLGTPDIPESNNEEDTPHGSGNKFKLIGDSAGKKVITINYKDSSTKGKLYTNHNLVDINQLISPDVRKMVFDNPELVILEGELMKYHPGVQISYVKRWIKLTSREFKYYKSRWSANCWDEKPLFTCPIEEMRAAFRVNMKLPKGVKLDGVTTNGYGKKQPKIYHFEIFTNNNMIPYDDENAETRNVVHHDTLSGLDTSKNQTSIFSTNLSQIQVMNVQEKHLMPSPARVKNEKYSYAGNFARKLNESQDQSHLLNESMLNARSLANKGDFSTRTVYSQLEAKANQLKKSFEERLTEKSKKPRDSVRSSKDGAVYNFVKNIEDLTSWSGREKEWYYSEKRLLFCTYSLQEREVWLAILSWLIEENNS